MLTKEQFDRTRRLALQLAGIELFERHRESLDRRFRRLDSPGVTTLDAMLDAAEHGDPNASQLLVGLLTTRFTGFFRHPRHFDVAARHALDTALSRGRARLWSAAAATGEEPYSLAMALIEVFRREDPPVTILATDIDAEVLVAAKAGEYGDRALQGLAPERREGFFTGTGAGRQAVAPAVRRLVEFRALNLAGVKWTVDGPFDVIFCRNVLMYLEACHRYAVLERMASLLAPDGLLLLDPTEHPGKAGHLFDHGSDGVYVRRNLARTVRDRSRASFVSV